MLITATADLWMPLLGASSTGASRRSLIYGTIGSVIGFFVLNLLGVVIGYALGILLGEYQQHGDWQLAIKSSLGGVAGMGISTLIQLGGAILMLIIFVWQVLSFSQV